MKNILLSAILLSLFILIGCGRDEYAANRDFENDKKSCDSGIASICIYIGFVYANGGPVEKVKKDYFKAKEYYHKACAGGENLGCVAYDKLNKIEPLKFYQN